MLVSFCDVMILSCRLSSLFEGAVTYLEVPTIFQMALVRRKAAGSSPAANSKVLFGFIKARLFR